MFLMGRTVKGQTLSNDLKVHYADDPDPEKAGQGLAFAPQIQAVLGQPELSYWMMSPAEQMAMVYLLEHLRPSVGIEIGTRFGGSLQVLAKYCDRVFSLDVDPDVPRRLAGKHSNVEYVVGSSRETLPPLLRRLSAEKAQVGFILVDGDHSISGVEADINSILAYRPVVPLCVIMHDSFNPDCRRGLLQARWADSPYVHAVELDFVPGTVNPSPAFRDQLWGGLALGILLPDSRQGRFEVVGKANRTYERVLESSRERSTVSRFRGFVRRIRGAGRANHPLY